MSAVSPTQATLMVPLDGSTFAESCLPLTDDLAQEWDASILLAQVVSRLPFAATLDGTSSHDIMGREIIRARTYLKDVAQGLSSPVETQVLLAPRVSDALVQLARDEQVTQVILSSHGRTGLSRLVLGNVAVSLVSHLSCPLIVVPASLAQETEDSVTSTPFPLPSA
jgi:nucleotide-binding universal stress UspA family protein